MPSRNVLSIFYGLGLICLTGLQVQAADPIEPFDSSDLLFTIFAEGPISESSPTVPPSPSDLALDEIEAENAARDRTIDPSRQFGQEAPPIRPPITFLRNEAVLLRKGQHMLDLGLVYSVNEYDLPVIVAPNNLTKAVIKDRSLYVPLAFRYGLTDNLQAQVYVPLGFSSEKLDVLGGNTFSDSTAPIGDTILSLNYSLPVEWTGQYNIIWSNAVSIPTGGARGLNIGPDAAFGNGYYQYSSSVLAIRRFDPLLVFGGFGTRYGFERKVKGFNIERGFSFDYQFGVGFGVNETMSLSAKLFGTFDTELNVNGQPLAGTERDVIALRFALTKAGESVICEPFVTMGLTQAAADAQLGMIFTFR